VIGNFEHDMARVLLVEDNLDDQKILRHALEDAGHVVQAASTGREGLVLARGQAPDIILLDILLPDVPGTAVCKTLKGDVTTEAIPLIFVSARGEEIDRVVGLELGADDYIVKPFSVRELLLRTEVVLRRQRGARQRARVVRCGPLRLDRDAHRVWVEDNELTLTVLEFKLLVTFLERPDRLQSRHDILAAVWSEDTEIEVRSVDTLVTRLRTKLGTAGRYIETVRGSGYRFSLTPAE
jgi:two-component system, OmpR family, phosphate regulon response regulator PhoB